jgi:phage gp29-like protein
VSIALLGQNQTTEADSTRASAQAGLQVTQDIRDGDKAVIEEAFNTLIRWICEQNFNDGVCPVFEMWEQEEVDKVLAERDEKLVRAGARLTPAYFKRAYDLQDGDLDETSPGNENREPDTADGKAEFAEGNDGPDAIDHLIEEVDDWRPVLDPMLGPLQATLAESAASNETAAEFIARLPGLLPDMDTKPLCEALARSAFTARVAGLAGLPLDDDDAA